MHRLREFPIILTFTRRYSVSILVHRDVLTIQDKASGIATNEVIRKVYRSSVGKSTAL